MATQYENLGPIYITAEKFEAARTAGTLEVGREYKIIVEDGWEPQEKLIAGTNITIGTDGKTISAAGGSSYTAGDGITITDNIISVTEAILNKQDKLTAGDNITITDNVISGAAYTVTFED